MKSSWENWRDKAKSEAEGEDDFGCVRSGRRNFSRSLRLSFTLLSCAIVLWGLIHLPIHRNDRIIQITTINFLVPPTLRFRVTRSERGRRGESFLRSLSEHENTAIINKHFIVVNKKSGGKLRQSQELLLVIRGLAGCSECIIGSKSSV